MFFTITMDSYKIKKLLAYFVLVSFLFAHPCSSFYDVQPLPPVPVLEAGAHLISHHRVPSQLLYRRLLDVSVLAPPSPSPSPSPSDISELSPPAPPRDLSELLLLAPLPSPTPHQSPSPTQPPTSDHTIGQTPHQSPSSNAAVSTSTGPSLSPVESLPYNYGYNYDGSSTNSNITRRVILAVSFVIGAILCFAGLFGWFLIRRKKIRKKNSEEESPRSGAPMFGVGVGAGAPFGGSGSDGSDSDPASRKLPKRYPFNTLAVATTNFNEKNRLGEGGFGPVYKGTLNDGKNEVAVKMVSKRAKGAPKQYKAEVKILTRLSHRNLVELLGWCEEESQFLLVYKFMPNGSLNSQLYSKSRLLTWGERYNIVLGLASALNYLHEECEECILHRDIKPDNVLLDSSFNAKLSDFGLARLVDHDLGSTNTTLAGTFGYLAPEHVQECKASKESDIYSFGVVLLEIACGRGPFVRNDDHPGEVTNLIDLVWDHYGRQEIVKVADKRLNGEYSSEQIERVMIVGLWCAHPIYTERPTIGDAISVLKFTATSPVLPPSRPLLLPLLADLRLLSNIRSSTGYSGGTRNSHGTGLSGSSGYATQSSHVSSSASGSTATT